MDFLHDALTALFLILAVIQVVGWTFYGFRRFCWWMGERAERRFDEQRRRDAERWERYLRG